MFSFRCGRKIPDNYSDGKPSGRDCKPTPRIGSGIEWDSNPGERIA